MSESVNSAEEQEQAAATGAVAGAPRKRRKLLRWLGCGILLPFWFLLLSLPCAMFYLAANGEIRLWHGEIPQPHAHPWLLVSLVSEKDDRGLRFETSSLLQRSKSDVAACVETNVRFLLWQTRSGNQDVTYCECYRRGDTDAAWQLQQTFGDYCPLTQ